MRAMWIIAALAGGLMATPVQSQDAAEGEAMFQMYCATCHGADGDGQGPMAPALLVQPKNLRTLTALNDGTFPLLRVVMRIDGREPLVSHGSDMPVFGPLFDGGRDVSMKTAAGQPVMMAEPVADLTAYLMSLQRP